MAGYRATPMQFQFLAVSGRAAGDASIRDQPPVKSRASPASPLAHPETKPGLPRSVSLSPSLILSFSLPPSVLLSFQSWCLPLALIPVNHLQPLAVRVSHRTSSPFRSPSLTSPSLAVSTVLMRQMRSPRATLVLGRALEGFGKCISDELCYPKLSCKDIRIRDEFETLQCIPHARLSSSRIIARAYRLCNRLSIAIIIYPAQKRDVNFRLYSV